MRDVGSKIRTKRLEKQVSEQEMAALLCMSMERYQGLEADASKMTLHMLLAIAEKLVVAPEELLLG